jgi:hypothetical protein
MDTVGDKRKDESRPRRGFRSVQTRKDIDRFQSERNKKNEGGGLLD